ncbi:MAG: hypothetical protein J5449_05045, partial [Oscillospiraceae bacterium]|nr:hypothetical protein [Oscillospiraceae bacterium]
DTEFAVPVIDEDGENVVDHTVYNGELVLRNDANGKSYLYDLLNLAEKKKAPAPPPTQLGDTPGQKTEEVGTGLPPTHTQEELPSNRSVARSEREVKQENEPKGSYSVAPKTDSYGVVLSQPQADYFKNSQARDDNGNILVLYHGGFATGGKGDGNVFGGRGKGYAYNPNAIYLTNSKEVGRAFAGKNGRLYELYANVTNPLILDAQGRNYTDIPIPEDAPQSLKDYFSMTETADADNLPVYAEKYGYIMPETGGINMQTEPTDAQYAALRRFISKNRGEVVVDYDNAQGDLRRMIAREKPLFPHPAYQLFRRRHSDFFLKAQGALIILLHLAKRDEAPLHRFGNEHFFQRGSIAAAPKLGENIKKPHASLKMLADKADQPVLSIAEEKRFPFHDHCHFPGTDQVIAAGQKRKIACVGRPHRDAGVCGRWFAVIRDLTAFQLFGKAIPFKYSSAERKIGYHQKPAAIRIFVKQREPVRSILAGQ